MKRKKSKQLQEPKQVQKPKKVTKPIEATKPIEVQKPIKVQEPKYSLQQIKRAAEFSDHEDILTALFNSDDLLTKTEVRKALKKHLEREV